MELWGQEECKMSPRTVKNMAIGDPTANRLSTCSKESLRSSTAWRAGFKSRLQESASRRASPLLLPQARALRVLELKLSASKTCKP